MCAKYSAEWWEKIPDINREISSRIEDDSDIFPLLAPHNHLTANDNRSCRVWPPPVNSGVSRF
jgi:hypothetical protein